jgi:DNA-binding MarR family transcriptional regulator
MIYTSEDKAEKTYQLIRRLLNRVGTQRTITGCEFSLTSLQTEALSALAKNGNLTMGEFSRAILTVQSSATRIADDLVKKGLIKRSEDVTDRRINRLEITTKGLAVLEKVRTEGHYLLKSVLKKMKPEEQASLINGIEAFLCAVDELAEESTTKCVKRETESWRAKD